MARNRKRKTEKGLFSDMQMRRAVEAVLGGSSLRLSAELYGLKFQTLARYVKKQRQAGENNVTMTPNYACRRVFTIEQEKLFKEYLVKCSKMCYGQSTFDVRKLAFEMATLNKIEVPPSWRIKKTAGLEWLHGFLKRNPDISIRRSENCSLSRMTAFNMKNVADFFRNLKNILARFPEAFSDGTRIFNMDETATTTVQKASKVIASKGIKQVCKATSSERGILVTTCCTVSASGNHIPPVMIFPRKKFNLRMVHGAVPGTLGLVSDSGWMTSELFPQVMKHFIKHTNSSQDNPSLLIYDNHESHMSIEAIKMAKESGVTVLTLPPHCSHKMQPLDVAVFFPFKNYYNAEVDNWMIRHPGQTLSIYDVAGCVSVAFDRSMKSENIKSGFRKSGIFPIDDQIFTTDDFLPAYVTDDRSLPNSDRTITENVVEINNKTEINNEETTSTEAKIIIISDVCINPGTADQNNNIFVSPEIFKGYPKAKERKIKTQKRKSGRSFIPTDSPEKNDLEALHNKRMEKQSKKSYKIRNVKKKVFQKEKKNRNDSDSDELSEDGIWSDSSSENDWNEGPNTNELINFDDLGGNLVAEDYVLVRFTAQLHW